MELLIVLGLALLSVHGQYLRPPYSNSWQGGYVGRWPSQYYQPQQQQYRWNNQQPAYTYQYPRNEPSANNYYQGDYYQDRRYLPEAVPRDKCIPRQCYKICRLRLLGGGRCDQGHCICYAGFFNYDGSPQANYYQEDSFWWDLTEAEKDQIRYEIKKWRDNYQGGRPSRPDYNPGGGGTGGGNYNPVPTQRPPYRPTYRPPLTTTKPPYRPPYRPPSTARPPYYGGGSSNNNNNNNNNWFNTPGEGSGGRDNDNDDEDDNSFGGGFGDDDGGFFG